MRARQTTASEIAQRLKSLTSLYTSEAKAGRIQPRKVKISHDEIARDLDRTKYHQLDKIAERATKIGYSNSLRDLLPSSELDIKAGDLIAWENINGVKWVSIVVGVALDATDINHYRQGDNPRCIYLYTDSYWMPIAPSSVIEVIRAAK